MDTRKQIVFTTRILEILPDHKLLAFPRTHGYFWSHRAISIEKKMEYSAITCDRVFRFRENCPDLTEYIDIIEIYENVLAMYLNNVDFNDLIVAQNLFMKLLDGLSLCVHVWMEYSV